MWTLLPLLPGCVGASASEVAHCTLRPPSPIFYVFLFAVFPICRLPWWRRRRSKGLRAPPCRFACLWHLRLRNKRGWLPIHFE
uniref:Secreted protein n=1 Tax=Ixodes ricinus TaxID=34613 RepID=A0A147BKB8_IXORI